MSAKARPHINIREESKTNKKSSCKLGMSKIKVKALCYCEYSIISSLIWYLILHYVELLPVYCHVGAHRGRAGAHSPPWAIRYPFGRGLSHLSWWMSGLPDCTFSFHFLPGCTEGLPPTLRWHYLTLFPFTRSVSNHAPLFNSLHALFWLTRL